MRCTAFSFLLALVAVAVATDESKGAPADKCFIRQQRCCYKFMKCGYKIGERKIKRRCDFKKCGHRCKYECTHSGYSKKKCSKSCYRYCRKVKAHCIKVKHYRAPRFCPNLECEHFKTKGDDKEPEVFIGKKEPLKKYYEKSHSKYE